MKLFCCQLDIVWEDKAANFARVEKLLADARIPAGSLVVLPEMFATGFSMNASPLAEPVSAKPGETSAFLARTACQFNIYLVGGLIALTNEKRARNQAVVFSPDGKELARYSKCQPFTLGGESKHYEAGCETISFKWHDCLVAPFVCYDLRFPELFRDAVHHNAELFLVIASWPIKRIQHWVTLLQARAIENQAYVAGVNRTGTDPSYVYNGRSLIVDPHGQILADAGDKEGMIQADIDLSALRAWRTEFPALQDMRAGEARRRDRKT